jgi:DNA-binding PadR family transcriptional regulator
MARERGTSAGWQRGFLGLYALHMMADHPIYVHEVANRIRDRTQGTWHPSPGAIYPAVRSLVERGLATPKREAGRTVFSLTPAGRARLRQFHANRERWRGRFSSPFLLMLDFVEPDQVAVQILDRVRADLGFAHAVVEGTPFSLPTEARHRLQKQLRVELEYALGRLAAPGRPESVAA